MSSWQHSPCADYRNEGWGVHGSGVSHMWECWSSTDDTKYCSSPSNKGRGTVSFPLDITAIPDGAVIDSVTIWVRAAKTSGSGRYSLTVNLVPSDDTSKFTTRTLSNLTTTPTNYEVATYKADPINNSWDRNRINKILCQVFSYCGVSDGVRVYRFYCTINYHTRPTLTVDAPSGTVTTPSPTLSWTYTQADGDIQKSAEWKIFTSDQQESPQFSPDTSTPVQSGTVDGDKTSVILPAALTPDEYYVFVRSVSSFTAKSLWTSRSFTVAASAPGVPGGGTGGGGSIGTGAGAGFVSVVADNTTSSAFLTMRDGSNLLSVQAANFENTTDYLGYTTSNCTVARDTSQFFNVGTASMRMTSSGAGAMQANSSFVQIAANTPVTARAQFKTASTSRTCNLRVLFFDGSWNALPGTLIVSVSDISTGWIEAVCTGTSPDGTVYAKVQVEVSSVGSAETHYVDAVGLMYGSNSAWSHGGHTSRNLLSAVASTADDPLVGSEPWSAVNLATAYTRASTSGTGSHGSKCFRLTYVGISPTLSFVAAGAAYSDTSTSTGYTLNKPAGVADGDLLIAYIAVDQASTCTPPAGWTLVNTASIDNSSTDVCLHILKRDGLAADPTTWVGNISVNRGRCRAVVVAYRGAASAANQFFTDKVATSSSGSTAITTATINNASANSWRLSAFAARDDAAGSTMIANILPPSTVPPIQFVSAGATWGRTSSSTSYTINKPPGVVSGDLMVAQVLAFGPCTVTAPSGWTVVKQTYQTDQTGTCTQAILKRTATSSEPNSWTGSIDQSRRTMHTQTVAYRNCLDASQQFLTDSQSVSGSGSTISTATVNNTNSNAMRVCAFSATTGAYAWFQPYNMTEVSQRTSDRTVYDDGRGTINGIEATFADSNGSISTGNTSRSATLDNSYYAAVAWIGMIKPLTAPPAPGGNETERTDGTTGAADPWITLAAYDSNGVAASGNQSVTGVVTPGSGSGIIDAASWIAILKPASPTVAGEASALLSDYVDISHVDPSVISLANNKVTFTASFLGSVAGLPYMSVMFYNGNELLNTYTATGESFDTSVWSKSSVTFDVPDGTTRMKLGVAVRDRAINDIVYFDQVSLAFGESTIYRTGTGGSAHPIWSVPVIEYADDDGTGYGDWSVLPGTVSSPPLYDPLTGLTSFNDQTIVPLSYRKYRVKTVSYGLAGDRFESAYGQDSPEVSVTAAEWWLKDPKDSSKSMKLKVLAEELQVGTTGTAAVFQPLGASQPVVLTEGYKGDRIEFTAIVKRDEFSALRDLLDSRRTLYLQTNMDNAWWVRPVGDIGATTKLTSKRGTDPLRFVKLSFVQVAPEM